MRKFLIVLFVVALSSACNTKPTREQCVEYTKPLALEVMEQRDLAFRWRKNYFKAKHLIELMQQREKKK